MEICKDCYKRRPNKRKALQFVFAEAKKKIEQMEKPFVYLTLGADQLLDVIDLMGNCYFEDIGKIFSYERDRHVAETAKTCLVSRIFNHWHREPNYRDKVEVIHGNFPYNLKQVLKENSYRQKVVFYDKTGWFAEEDAQMLSELFKRRLIGTGDIFLVTSSQDKFLGWKPTEKKGMKQYRRYFAGNIGEIESDVVRENIVDVFVDQAVKIYNGFDKATNSGNRQIAAGLLAKVQYQDAEHSRMGVWAYCFEPAPFEAVEIPVAFSRYYISDKGVNIFKNLLSE